MPPVVQGLKNLSPLIKENAETVNFLDINPASRSAVSFNGTVRALPLDTDYVAIGWRQDVFYKHGLPLEPPKTIEEFADLSEFLNGLDHNDDGEPDWGVCISPQVNYFYAFVAPILQTQLLSEDLHKTGQNLFFDANTFEPLIRLPGFRYGLEHYWRIIRTSNCQGQLSAGQKCDRRPAFKTGRCAMVISMPGTLTSMLNGSRVPLDRLDDDGNVVWSIVDQPLGLGGSYWGRRAAFPGSRMVQSWEKEKQLVPCEHEGACPTAGEDGVNYAPFFAEGGEAYALNGRQSKPAAQSVMWDLFTWLADLPVTQLPLSGQYRKSHLNEEGRQELLVGGNWPEQMVDDSFLMLEQYFKSEEEGGNPAQDLLMLGFPEYMNALDEELHDKLLGVKVDSEAGLFDKNDPSRSVDPVKDAAVFDEAYDLFLNALEERYEAISKGMSGGILSQLQRWRQSLNLPWKSDVEICSTAISIDIKAFDRLGCLQVVDMRILCQAQPDDVAVYDVNLCSQYYGSSSNTVVLVTAIVIPGCVLLLLLGYLYIRWQKKKADSLWIVNPKELVYEDPPKVLGTGRYGVVLLAEYRGTMVAVKKLLPQNKDNIRRVVKRDCSISDELGFTGNAKSRSISTSSSLSDIHTASGSMTKSKHLTKFMAEMRLLSKLRHPCITTIMGAVIDKSQETSLVMEYMELGSLYELLHNQSVDLDGELVLQILQDIAKGVRFLHSADSQLVHGDLKASNILIDSKFSAKVADFGLSGKQKKNRVTGTLLWMAPELLRGDGSVTAASDVYSFGVILYEVYARKDPYEGEHLSEIIDDIADPIVNKRPQIPQSCPPKIGELMKDCFEADPKARPTFEEIDLRLQRMSAENARPGEAHLSLRARKEKKASASNDLLLNVFPAHVAEALRDGRKVEAEQHDCVTIFFSDIVGFTTISSTISPEKVMDMLDRLYLKFDELSIKYDVFKMETIGDAYMAVSNIVKDQSSDHATRIALFAFDAINAANETLIDTEDPDKGCVRIRVGFHSGPVVSNVIGSRVPKYSVFGDTVNTASRMESNSLPGRVQCSRSSARLLQKQGREVQLEKRGKIEAKGKGKVTTFWVNKSQPGEDRGLIKIESALQLSA